MFSKGVDILQKQRFDVILCSTSGLITPLGVAKRLSDKFNIPWIADLRDIMEQYNKDDITLRERIAMPRIRLRRNFLLRKAAAVISVSPWHVDLLGKINSNAYLIYNGYDPDLFKFEQPRVTSKFTMCHPGGINHHRDVSLLFTALARLIEDKIINPNRFQISIYSDKNTQEYVMTRAKLHGIQYLVNFNDYVSATAIPDILHNSSILLSLAEKATQNDPKGIMTTKFFEYLGTGRPILLTKSDESYLEQTLLEANAGIAARSVSDAYNFIKDKYLEWQAHGYTTGTTDQRVIKKYSRAEQAKQFVSIFENTICKRQK